MKTFIIVGVFITLISNNIFSEGRIAYIDHLSDTNFSPQMKEEHIVYVYVISEANIKVQVLDSNNRVIFEFKPDNNAKEGMRQYKWDGKDATGKVVSPGVYKYLVSISDIDNTYSYVEEAYVNVIDAYVKDIPPVVEEILYEEYEVAETFPVKTKINGVSETQIDSAAINTRSVPIYEVLRLKLRTQLGKRIKSALDLDLQSAPIKGVDSVYMDNLSVDYNLDNINVSLFYRKHVGFYNTPLKLFSSYRAPRDRIGLISDFRLKSFYSQVIMHSAHVENKIEHGICLRLEQKLGNIVKLGLSSVNQLRKDGSNIIVGVDGDLSIFKMINMKAEVAYSGDTQMQKKDVAYRIETSIPVSLLKFSFNYQDIGQEFIYYYSDIPHGTDSKGYELKLSLSTKPSDRSFLRLFGINLGFENYNNHFENLPVKTISANMMFDLKNNLNTFIAYSITDSSSSVGLFKTENGFVNMRYKISNNLEAGLWVISLNGSSYSNTSVRVGASYLLRQAMKIISEVSSSQRTVSVLNRKQEYNINSIMLGNEWQFRKKISFYAHVRFSQQAGAQNRIMLSGYLSGKYDLLENVSLTGSYGSYTDLENQNRFFLQCRVLF